MTCSFFPSDGLCSLSSYNNGRRIADDKKCIQIKELMTEETTISMLAVVGSVEGKRKLRFVAKVEW